MKKILRVRPGWSLLKPVWLLPVVVWAGAMLWAGTCLSQSWLARAERFYSDSWHQLTGQRAEATQVLLVLIDEATLDAYPDTPLVFWSPLFAKTVQVLQAHGARVIGLDFLFSVSAERWLQQFQVPPAQLNYDQALRTALSEGHTVLAASYIKGAKWDQPLLPVADLWFALPEQNMQAYLGWVNLQIDDDGTVRRLVCEPPLRLPAEAQDEDRPRLSFPALLSQHAVATDAARAELQRLCDAQASMRINFTGPPGTVPKLSMARLLQAHDAGPLPPEMHELIRDKVIIVAADSALYDNHATPYATGAGARSQWMTGAEIHANAVETLLRHAPLRDAPWPWALLGLGALLAPLAWLLRTWSPSAGGALSLGACGAVAVAGYAAFTRDTLLPVAVSQGAVMLMFGAMYAVRFVGEIRVRRHIESAFGRYVSKTVVDDLVASGKMPQLGGETMEVTVLFSDIRNFTSMSERLQSQQVVHMVNTYFAGATQCVLDQGGNIDKFIGDAIMAEFGAPIRRADHALCAITAAVKMIDNLASFRVWFRQHLPELAEFEFDIGIGIHTGAVTMGNVGTAQRTEYTALGDTVNAAARLEGATKETGFHIVASDVTVTAAGPRVITGRRAQLHVKGRKEPLVVHEVLGLRPASDA